MTGFLNGGYRLFPAPGNTLGMAGDSIGEYEFNTGSGATQRATGLVINQGQGGNIAHAIARDPRVTFQAWANVNDQFGLSGNTGRYYDSGCVSRAAATLGSTLNQVNRLAVYNPSIIIINPGTNSLSSGTFQQDHLSLIDRIHTYLPNCKIGVCNVQAVGPSQNITPRTVTNIQNANTLIAANVTARSSFCTLIDLYTPYSDAGDGTSLRINYSTAPYQASDASDDLHPGPFGASTKGADPILAFIQANVPSTNVITARKITSVLPAGISTNTGSSAVNHTATIGGGTITGFVPTGMDLAIGNNNNVSDFVSSVVSNGVGGQDWIIQFTPSGTATQETVVIRPSGINYTTTNLQNQWAEAYWHFQVDQGSGWLTLSGQSAEKSNLVGNFQAAALGIYPHGSGTRDIWLNTPPMKYIAGSTGFQPSVIVRVNPNLGGGVNQTITLKSWDVQTISSPIRP